MFWANCALYLCCRGIGWSIFSPCVSQTNTVVQWPSINILQEEWCGVREFRFRNRKIESVEFNEKTRSSRIKIHCDIHGSIFTTKGYLTRSPHKCPNCGKDSMGYAGNRLKTLVEKNSLGRATFIGVMSVEVFGIQSIKVGVTTRTLQDRYKWNLKTIHFSAQLHEIDAYVLENQIHRRFIKNHH